MHFEKMNDNQIRCTLTEQDLRERHITLSDLAYGAENTRSLFHEMLDTACEEFDFQAEDVPLMIEAVPLKSGGLILIITRTETPDELDSHFARFADLDSEDPEDMQSGPSADEILDLFGGAKADFPDFHEDFLSGAGESGLETEEAGKAPDGEADREAKETDHLRIYRFRDLDRIIELSLVLNGIYGGENSLYRNPETRDYYLTMRRSYHTVEEFNRICNMMAEYAPVESTHASREAFIREHYRCIAASTALTRLSQF